MVWTRARLCFSKEEAVCAAALKKSSGRSYDPLKIFGQRLQLPAHESGRFFTHGKKGVRPPFEIFDNGLSLVRVLLRQFSYGGSQTP
jgi:hypothetical protein